MKDDILEEKELEGTEEIEEAIEEVATPIEADETAEEAPVQEKSEEVSPLMALVNSGLSEREALLVLSDREKQRSARSAASDSLPRMAHSPRLNISYSELMEMKEIFEGLSDTEINRLYNKVTK